jgi:hypothetical protein
MSLMQKSPASAYDDVTQFIAILERAGLIHLRDSKSEDLTVVDQQEGLMESCDWIECASFPTDGTQKIVKACRLKGGQVQYLHIPDGWKWENSLYSSGLRRDGDDSAWQVTEFPDGVDELRHPLFAETYYSGRPFRKKKTPTFSISGLIDKFYRAFR